MERSAAANTLVQTPHVIPDARIIVSISAKSIHHQAKRIDQCLDYDGVVNASQMYGFSHSRQRQGYSAAESRQLSVACMPNLQYIGGVKNVADTKLIWFRVHFAIIRSAHHGVLLRGGSNPA